MMSKDTPDLSAYAGRWVALFGPQIAGVGLTAEAAAQMARHSRPKERFIVRFVDDPAAAPLPLSPLLAKIRPLLAQQSQPVYLVGGAVRDALLGRISHDLDFAVPEKAIALAFLVADALALPAYVLDRERDTGRVVWPEAQTTLDFARFRGGDLITDLGDRDLTINAMALPATAVSAAGLLDPHDGQADLAAGLIRPVHNRSFMTDPVRTLRAVRLSYDLGFARAPETDTAVRAAASRLPDVSTERLRDELLRLLQMAAPYRALADLASLGLLAEILPEIASLATVTQSPPHREPVLAHTLAVLRWLTLLEDAWPLKRQGASGTAGNSAAPAAILAVKAALGSYAAPINQHWQTEVDGGVNGRVLLRLAALFHDAGKAQTQTVEPDGRIRFLGHEKVGAALADTALRRLCLSNQAINRVEKIVAGHMRPFHLAALGELPSRRSVYRYFRDTEAAGLDIALLSLADHLATYDGPGPAENWRRLLAIVGELCHHYFEKRQETVAPVPLLDGRTLMRALSLQAGPEVGRLLRLILEAQAAGELETAEAAIEFARLNHDQAGQ